MHRIGIIGLGIMGRRVAEAILDHPQLQVMAGFDPDPPRDLPGILLKDSAAAVINDPLVDCVYIASPPITHAGLVAAAAAAGKAIFCEKPLTASIAEAHDCVREVSASGVAAAVNFPFASAPSAIRVREMVLGGDLGTIVSATLTLRFARWPRGWQAGATGWLAGSEQGGFTREVISHFLFFANRLLGSGVLDQTHVQRSSAETETGVHATIRYGDVTLIIDAAISGDVDDYNRFAVTGTRATAALTDWYRLEANGHLSERIPPLPRQLDALSHMLSGKTDHGLATFEEAAAVVELVEDMLI
jgi:predicted dehydrogenase